MKAALETLKPEILSIFNHLHHHPEISWKETQTTAYIQRMLEQNGCRVTRFSDTTGVIGELGQGDQAVAIRADLDALWQEVNGIFQANHSCGHDAHMTIVIGTLLLFKKLGQQIKGRIKFIFQPAEEKGTGALKMVEKGVVDDVNFLYGVHLRPIQELPFGKAAPAILHGSAQFIQGTIHGEDAHGARPHLGTNAIEVATALVQHIGHLHVDPMVPHSIKMTQLQAGGESLNIIPGSATFGLDLRAQTNKVMEDLEKGVDSIRDLLAKAYSVEIKTKQTAMVAAAKVHPEAERIMEKAIAETIGKENVVPPLVTTGGDDFHFYTVKRPNLKATMLGLGADLTPGLHHPKMTFNREAIFSGIEIMAKAILLTLEGGPSNG